MRVQRAEPVRQLLGQHRDHAIGEVDGRGARPRLAIERRVGLHVVAHVGDRDEQPPAVARSARRTPRRRNRARRRRRSSRAAGRARPRGPLRALPHLAPHPRASASVSGESCGMPCDAIATSVSMSASPPADDPKTRPTACVVLLRISTHLDAPMRRASPEVLVARDTSGCAGRPASRTRCRARGGKRPTICCLPRARISTRWPSRPRGVSPGSRTAMRSPSHSIRISRAERYRSSPPSSGVRKPKPSRCALTMPVTTRRRTIRQYSSARLTSSWPSRTIARSRSRARGDAGSWISKPRRERVDASGRPAAPSSSRAGVRGSGSGVRSGRSSPEARSSCGRRGCDSWRPHI